jgi:hypothetical protein
MACRTCRDKKIAAKLKKLRNEIIKKGKTKRKRDKLRRAEIARRTESLDHIKG